MPGAKPRAILTMLGLHAGSIVAADTLIELLWGEDPPRTAAKALQTHISSLRRALGDGFVLTEGTGWKLSTSETDASRYKRATRLGRDAAATGETSQAVARFEEARSLWRGTPELPDTRRGVSEKTRWIEGHAALVEDRADALLTTGRAAELIGELEAAVADAPLRERRWGQLMLALYRAGRQGEALAAYQRARSLLADELGVDPGPELRRLETAIVAQDAALDIPVAQNLSTVTRAVTFLLTDIEGSTAAWEADAEAMAVALARHDELVEQVVTSRGGRLIKTRGEGDATFSVFDRPSAAAAAAIELQDAIGHEPWVLREPMRVRVALHTGEAELRDGDYFGRAVNRAARLRSLAEGGQILCSGATAELVIDSLSDDVLLFDLGMRQLKNLARPEHVFELRLETAESPAQEPTDAPLERPGLPAVLTGPGPFVGRGPELEGLVSGWQTALAGGTHAVLIAGEPGVGKTRLAGEWSRHAYEQGAVVLYGRCDEDLGAPYQPFAEALRSLVPCLAAKRLRGMRGVEALLALVPGLTDVLPDLAAPTRADPDTERYALFDAVVALCELASASAPVVLILDDLHWAAKPTLLLLRHLLRFGDHARMQIVGTYRSTDLDRSHPLAAMLADLHRDGTANRLQLSGLGEDDVTAFVAEAGYDDEELARALASVTGGNPFFLIEALRHVDESGGVWDPSTLPQGVRETVSRRLSRLSAETNTALAAAAVVGSRFPVELVERVVDQDLVDQFDEACKAGIVIEEPGGRYRFNHAIVRQSLLAELASVRRLRLHQRIAMTLETQPGADDELLAELAYHYFECAWAGNAAKAVDYCRRAADQAMARLAYEGAADLYDRALHALEEIDDELPDRNDQVADLLIARCEALLAAGDVTTATGAVAQLQRATADSARLAAWATCFDGELSMLVHPERLDDIETALAAAAGKLAELDDAAGEAKAHTVRATCLARLGRVGDCEIALDDALTAARRAGEHRRVNAVLAGAPLAALWGPNPVPRAGGRCLDVVRLLRITTDSPAVEATSTRCQAVLEAFRGRAEAARRMIDSARRTVTELGLRHALVEVEQFAGIVELVAGDPAAAEPHLRQAYNGFRRMGLDADTAETAALLGRACLVLNQEAEADELCTESERLAGNALKPSIAWRTLRARLLSRRGDHDEAKRIAEAAVALAERTDALVDHGDACLSLATVLGAAGDNTAARATAERAADLYERKGAAALAERARSVLGERIQPIAPTPPETPAVEFHTAAAEVSKRAMAAIDRENWDEFERLVAPEGSVESRRKVVGFKKNTFSADDVQRQTRRDLETGIMRASHVVIAVRGERLALARVTLGTADLSDGAPRDEFLHLYSVNEQGRIALQIWFDVDDMDAAIAELDALHARFEAQTQRQVPRLENAASRVYGRWSTYFANRNWAAITEMLADGMSSEDRRRVVNSGLRQGRDAAIAEMMALAGTIGVKNFTSDHIAIRGERLVLSRTRTWGRDQRPDAFHTDALDIVEIDADERVVARVVFELDDFDAAIAELDARYLNGEAASYAETWSSFATAFAGFNRRQLKVAPGWVNVDHRRGAAFEAGDMAAYIDDLWNDSPDVTMYVEVVRRLSNLGVVITQAAHGTSQQGFEAEWRANSIFTFDGDLVSRCELFDEEDLGGALARFDQLGQPARRLENAASRVFESEWSHFAARDWDALAELVAHNYSGIDHRRVVRAENQHGRDVVVNDLQAAADVGFTISMVSAIAIRGERLVLARVRACGRDPKAIQNDALNVIEIDAEERIVAAVTFDLEDFDAAIAELDARYLAGEAAAHAHAWSVIMRAYAAVNRHEIAPTTPNFASIDHRQGTKFAPGDLIAYLRATWDLEQQDSTYVEAVHRLDSFGAVVTHVTRGSSKDGFDAEWREVFLLTIEGELLSRCELFDEADLDTAIARFEELSRPAPGLENSAIRTLKRYFARFAARDWDVMAEELTDDFLTDDRRRVVNAGVRRGRDPEIANMQSFAEIGMLTIAPIALATRGERLVLCRHYVSFRDWAEPSSDVIGVVEINPDNEICAHIMFDANDFDAAMAELDARYLTGEAADHARTWSLVEAGYAALNRHELPATTRDWVDIDHRPVVPIETGDLGASLRAVWDDLAPQAAIYVETVHRLNTLGAVMTHVVQTTSRDGFDAEWRDVALVTFEGDKINRCEVFDEADLDTAIAKFDQLSRPAPGLENRASQVAERFLSYFASCDLDAMAQLQADDISIDDRRPVVNAGIRRGRDAAVQDARANADVGAKKVASTVIATRGERLALCRARYSGGAEPSETYHVDVLSIYEIDADERIAAVVTFGPNDFDAAFDELDVRYLAGEAAPYAHTWAAVAAVFVAVKRHEMSPTTPNFVDIDRRRLAVEAGGFEAYLHSIWDVTDYVSVRITAVHRLTALGAVVTHASHAISHEGLDAEWQNVNLLTFDGDMVSRSELFDEADLDAAIARFEELHPTTRRLENTASRVFESEWSHFAARDWDALGELVADNYSGIDHRRVVNTENQYGRDAVVRDLQAAADVGFAISMLSAMAIRGERLVLARICASGRGPDGIRDEALNVIEIDTDDRIVAASTFDLEDIDAAFAELDARYLAGEAAPYAQTWTLTLRTFAAVNRQELPPTTPDWVNVDHRPVVGSHVGEVWAALRAVWELVPEVAVNIEAVHQLSDSGAVVTFAARGVSGEGFDAEWRAVTLITFEGDLLKRGEVFAEADLAAALAKFAELNRPTTHLENTASRVDTRFQACFAARDWDAMAEMVSDGFSIEDRRRVVNMGNLQGRDAELGVHSYAVVGSENVKATVIATRAQRLALSHYRFSGPDQRPDAFRIEMLALVEIDADDRMAAVVVFDADDIDAAFAELDARYRVGEAAAHARTWSVIASAIAAHNRREIAPTTPDVMTIDHRRAAAFAPGEGIDYLRAGWDLDQTLNIYIETAHRLSDRGAVFTWTGQGRSREGFAAEWRGVNLMLVDGEMVARSEVFDAEDLETALAKFDQLTRPAPRLENEASQAAERFRRCFAARDWDGLAQVLAEDMVADDRRRVVGIGIRRGRQANVADVRAGADLGTEDITSTPIATRGDRIFLDRARFSANDQQPDALSMELLRIVEVDAENRYTRCLMFDVDDFEAAFTELDARYIAGEAAAHSDVWSAVAGSYAALNRREPPLTTPDCVNVDHRRETAFGPGDLAAYIHTGLDLDPGIVIYVEQVHRLTDIGAIVTYAAHETSQEGFQAEWRGIAVFTVEGGRVNRTEVFDESHIEAAIARFEELSRPAPRLENAASRVGDRFFAHFAAGEWDAMAEILADNLSNEDRRRVVSTGIFDGRDAQMANMRTVAELWSTTATRTVMAIRGTNLSLARVSFWRGEGVEAFLTEFLAVMEIDADERILATVVFDVDDFDAAIAELDARYLAGEAAPYSAVWSVVMEGYAALNRHERPLLTPDVVSADHRRGRGFAPGDLPAWLDASWELMPQSSLYIEDVHRLNDIGIVVTHVVHGTTAEGFVAEWREINLLKAAGDRVSRCEVFDEDDLDAALASFEEFSRPALRLENAATRTVDRVNAYFGARDWEALGAIMAPDVVDEDRRRVANAGLRQGRDAVVGGVQTAADLGAQHIRSTAIATRGDRLALSRSRYSGRDQRPEAFYSEALGVFEIDVDGRVVAHVAFDLQDIDAAFEELETRYLAGEAAANAHTWSLVRRAYAALNRRELPPTAQDWVDIDHRRLAPIAAGDLGAYLRATWDLSPQSGIYIETVHRLSKVGAVVTHVVKGTSQQGFDAEWRTIDLSMYEGDQIKRSELFDETDLEAAIARFDELNRPAPRLENAASQVDNRFNAYFTARDWAAMRGVLADDVWADDRRRVVNAGVVRGSEALIANMQAIADVGAADPTWTFIATRGERLVLVHQRMSSRGPELFHIEMFAVVEINADNRISSVIAFDVDDLEVAVAELDSRYLASEAAAHAHTWSVIAAGYAALNRREVPESAPGYVIVDHQLRATINLEENLSAAWDLTPDLKGYVESVHRLSDAAAVVTHAADGTSQDGVHAEWRGVHLLTLDGDRP
ncbi:regulator [Mycobacterium sp. 1245111.1]|nr:regulator [Mycobacterium sp. 1245111.1]